MKTYLGHTQRIPYTAAFVLVLLIIGFIGSTPVAEAAGLHTKLIPRTR